MKYFGPKIKAVLFDHDDTLVATIEAKWATHKHIARTHYDKKLTDDEIRLHWGKPLSALVGLLYGTDDIAAALECEMAEKANFPKKLHGDTIDTLIHLHKSGKKLGVITATSRQSFSYDLETLGIPKNLFDYIQTEDDTSFHKPDHRVFEPALTWLQQQGIKPSEVVYVGDGLHDMKAALDVGFEFIGVSTGLVTQEEFETNGATNIKTLSDLINAQ